MAKKLLSVRLVRAMAAPVVAGGRKAGPEPPADSTCRRQDQAQ